MYGNSINISSQKIAMRNLALYLTIGIYIFILGCKKNTDDTTIQVALQNEPPLSFNLLDAPDGSTEVDVKPSLSWESAKNPKGKEVTYNLYLDENLDPITLYESGITTTSFQLTKRLHLLTDYRWKVVAKDVDGKTSQSAIHNFTTRNLSIPSEPVTISAQFSKRYSHTSVSFKGKLWVLGGTIHSIGGFDDVWQSTDGINWIELGEDVLIRPKRKHASVIYDDKMWILGGGSEIDGENLVLTHDVWNSVDGVVWENLTSYTDYFTPRKEHSSVVFNDKIYVIGGDGNIDVLNDIWQYDGQWSEVQVNAPVFSARRLHSSIVYDNKIWVIGGTNILGDHKNDVWSSSDGIHWVQVTHNASFSPRFGHDMVVYDDKMWVIGGIDDSGRLNEIWYSENGLDWKNANAQESFPRRSGHTVSIHDNKIYLIGGTKTVAENETLIGNDVWILD